ncbi:ADP-ribosyltransferase [Streptomyces aureoversilis]|uniref:ADP-ribosyltransferase n=1 Tax=Streptomyces aureoversilis TaxID=67277 RepID=A0ABV9ZQI4_9ACTN
MSPGPLPEPEQRHDPAPAPEAAALSASPAAAVGDILAARLKELQQQAGNAATAAHALGAGGQQAAAGAPFGHRRLVASPRWHQEAELYEQRLGAALAAAPEVGRAARTAVLRLNEVLSAEFTAERAAGAFLKDDPASAGQVGTGDTAGTAGTGGTGGDARERLLQWTAPGSSATVRELVTAFYNAAYYKYGPQPGLSGDDRDVSFKTLLHRIVLDGDLRRAREVGLDTEALSAQREYLTGATRSVLGQLPQDIGRLFAKDIFALGNMTLQHGTGTTVSMGRSQQGRTERPEAAAGTGPGRSTLRNYQDLGVPLSEAERAHAQSSTTPLRVEGVRLDGDRIHPQEYDVTPEAIWAAVAPAGEQGPEFPLPWASGQALFAMNPAAAWYRKHHERGAPLVAGISGTTTRMLSAFRWLKAVPGGPGGGQERSEREFFLAVASWMLTGRDHSLYEILRGAKAAGLASLSGITASSKDVAAMYRDFDAFVRATLPRAKLPELPYAALYEQEAQAEREDGGMLTVHDDTVRAARRKQRRLQRQAGGADGPGKDLDFAHFLALTQYTGDNHQLINRVLTTPGGFTSVGVGRLIDEMISRVAEGVPTEVPFTRWRDDELQGLISRYTAPGIDDQERKARLEPVRKRMHALAGTLRAEAKTHADMLADSLHRLPPVTGSVYRAGWEMWPRKRIAFDGFTSTSEKRKKAEEFLPLQYPTAGGRRVLYRLELSGRSGRDISAFSQKPEEKEVLLLPGAAFTVQLRNRDEAVRVNGQEIRYDFVWATEATG